MLELSPNDKFSPVLLCQDVINAIIDCFDEWGPRDKRMLSTCTLVCRDWRHHSQIRLLRSIVLDTQERLDTFILALATLSERTSLLIRALCVGNSDLHRKGSNPLIITIANVATCLRYLKCLRKLDFCQVLLQTNEEDSFPDLQPCRSLQRLSFHNITNPSLSCHPIREIAAIGSLLGEVQQFSILVHERYMRSRGGSDLLEFSVIREGSKWITAIARSLRPKSLTIAGLPTTNLIVLRMLRVAHATPMLKQIYLSAIDVDIAAEMGAILKEHPSVIETMTIEFGPYVSSVIDETGTKLLGYLDSNAHPESMAVAPLYLGPLHMPTQDMSLLSSLHELTLSYTLRVTGHWVDSSLAQWAQVLEVLAHFSPAPVKSIRIDLCMNTLEPPGNVIPVLDQMRWSKVDDILRRYGQLENVYVVLPYYSDNGAMQSDRNTVVRFLECIAKEIPSYSASGKVHLEWMYHNPWPVRFDLSSLYETTVTAAATGST